MSEEHHWVWAMPRPLAGLEEEASHGLMKLILPLKTTRNALIRYSFKMLPDDNKTPTNDKAL
jgi:hypothetical protein